MIQRNNFTHSIHSASLITRLLVGGGIALILITVFLLGAPAPNPAWPKLWMLRPLIIVPLAGATGGAVYHLLDHMRAKGGWSKVLTVILALIIYLIGLWMGMVLGLDGTWWD
jgi:hypothetical protein